MRLFIPNLYLSYQFFSLSTLMLLVLTGQTRSPKGFFLWSLPATWVLFTLNHLLMFYALDCFKKTLTSTSPSYCSTQSSQGSWIICISISSVTSYNWKQNSSFQKSRGMRMIAARWKSEVSFHWCFLKMLLCDHSVLLFLFPLSCYFDCTNPKLPGTSAEKSQGGWKSRVDLINRSWDDVSW